MKALFIPLFNFQKILDKINKRSVPCLSTKVLALVSRRLSSKTSSKENPVHYDLCILLFHSCEVKSCELQLKLKVVRHTPYPPQHYACTDYFFKTNKFFTVSLSKWKSYFFFVGRKLLEIL